MPVSSVTEHWIKPDAVTINLNHFGDPDYLQVSVLAGAVVMAFKQDIIGYNAAHNYRTWPLQAANTYLETNSSCNVYARLTRSEMNASALIVYDPILRDIEGRPISFSEDGTEILGEADPAYFYVFLGQISESLDNNGNKKEREWLRIIQYGSLDSSEQKNNFGLQWEKLFKPHYDDPNDPGKLSWIEAKANMGIQGGVSMIIKGNNINIPTIAEGLPFDQRTIWFNPTTKQIEVIGGVSDGEGGVSNFWALNDIPAWITITKPIYKYSEIDGTPDLSVYALKNDIPSLSGYATEAWVLGKGYALNSELSALTTKVNDFLEGSDTDNIINKWKELEAFLIGLDGSNDLATILSWKADKTYVDDTFVSLTKDEDVNGKKNFVKGLSINGVNLYNTKDDIVYLDGNLVVKGGVTMYALDDATVDSIIDSLPTASTSAKGIASFDGSYFTVDANGKVSIIPDSVGLNDVELDAYLTQYKYATHDWVTSQGYLKAHQTIHSLTIKRNGTELGVYTPNSSAKEMDIIVPTKVSDLDNDSKFISGITSVMVVGALGYTPYNSASFTKTNIKSTLGISDWALATSKPSYKTSEVTEETNLYFTNARAVSALKSITDSLATDIATKWTQNNDKIANWDTAYGWGDHSKNDYTTNKYVNDTFVTIGGTTEQTITSDKNFTGKLKVNGGTITYSSDGYWKLDGDLIVTGGVSMYSNDTPYVASTIMDAIAVDGTTISKDGGVLKVIGDLSGGITDFWALENIPSWIGLNKPSYTIGELSNVGSWADSVASQDRIMYQAANSSQWVAKNLSDLSVGGVSGDYLPLTGGTLYGALNFADNVWNNVGVNSAIGSIGSYRGQLAVKSVSNNSPGIAFFNSSATHLGSLQCSEGILYWRDNIVLNANNYSSYALPLSGGTLTGSLEIKTNSSYVHFKDSNGIDRGSLGVLEDNNAYVWKPSKGWKTILDIDNYSSYALPLSGGTITNNSAVPLTINANNDGQVGLFLQSKGNNKTYVGWDSSRGTCLYEFASDSSINILNGVPRFNNNTLWHSGNDGSGSGIDADLLDGKHYSDIINGNVASATKSTYSRYIGNVGRDGTTWYDTEYPIYFQWGGSDGNSLYIKCGNYPIISTAATKLETARKIWGHHFDGTSDIDGDISSCTKVLFSGENGIYRGDKYSGSLAMTDVALNGTKIVFGGGTVGMGTINPSAKLHVEGVVYANMNTVVSPAFRWNKSGSYYSGIGYNGTKNCNEFGSVNADNTWANADIDTWKFRGNILATGGVTMYSDIRKKTKLKDVVLSLQQVANAPLIEHYYNSDQNKTTHVGSIAQYWAEMNDWFCKEDSEGYYTMEIQNAALASAISIARELDKYESKTDKKIRQLKKRISQLEDELEKLKSM